MERKYNFSFKHDMPIMSIDEKFEWEEVRFVSFSFSKIGDSP